MVANQSPAISDLPPEMVAAAAVDAERQAQWVAQFLGALGEGALPEKSADLAVFAAPGSGLAPPPVGGARLRIPSPSRFARGSPGDPRCHGVAQGRRPDRILRDPGGRY